MLISIIIISLIGTISHFMYDITNHNKIIGLFAAVNESTWEHIKIALTPSLLWGLIDGYMYGSNPNYFIAKFFSLLSIIVLMPTLFYGYKYLLKKDVFILDIIIFYVVIILSQMIFYSLLGINNEVFFYNYISCVGMFLLFGGYMIHTLMPANSFIFKDPISNKFGFKGHTELTDIKQKKASK